jgi:tetratricopeptide (TPR) repeat protein
MLFDWMIDFCRLARFYTFGFALALLLSGSSVALTSAQPLSDRLDKAKVLFVEGQKAYVQGDLAKALSSFREAHRLVPSAELAYNIGHISEQLGDFEDAIRFLGLYLSRSLASVKDQKEIEKRIARLRDKVREQREQLSKELRIPAAPAEKARAFFDKAIAMVKQGRYQAALVSFTIALGQYQLPEVHFNIAKLAEHLGRTRDAVKNYRAYLIMRRDAADREAVEKKIAQLVAVERK